MTVGYYLYKEIDWCQNGTEYLNWLNRKYSEEEQKDINNALKKTTFQLKKTPLKKPHPLSKSIL